MRTIGIIGIELYEAESIEKKMQKATTEKTPIENASPNIYTERKEGVKPEYNPRTDRFDVAIEAMDKVAKSYRGKRADRIKAREKEAEPKKAEPTPTESGQHE